MTDMTLTAAQPRWHGLDIIRLVAFFNIIFCHIHLIYFGTPYTPYVDKSWIFYVIDQFCHALSFSGFVIVLLSSALLAVNQKRGTQSKLRLMAVLLFGWLLLSVSTVGLRGVTWDIFGLFSTGMLVMLWLEQYRPKYLRTLGGLGFLLLWIPFWKLEPFMPEGYDALKNVFGVASCQGREVAEWPVLPWIGLVWFGYWIGNEVRRVVATGDINKLRLSRSELGVWVLLLGASVTQLGAYHGVRLGQFFSCDVYRQEPSQFWGHMIWPMFLMRLSVEPHVQAALSRRKWAQWVSQLTISRKFWVAYASSYLYCMLFASVANYWELRAPLSFETYKMPIYEFMGLTLLIQCELVARWAVALIKVAGRVLDRWPLFNRRHAGEPS